MFLISTSGSVPVSGVTPRVGTACGKVSPCSDGRRISGSDFAFPENRLIRAGVRTSSRGPGCGDAAVLDQEHMRDSRDHLLRTLGDEDDLRPFLHQFCDGRGQGWPAAGVQTGEGIVQDQDLRSGEERPGDQELPVLAVGEGPDAVAEEGAKVQDLDETVQRGRVAVLPRSSSPAVSSCPLPLKKRSSSRSSSRARISSWSSKET